MSEKSWDKTVGVIAGESRVVEWILPKFLWLTLSNGIHYSPKFSLWCRMWRLSVRLYADSQVDVCLSSEEIDPQTTGKTVTCVFGIKKWFGTLEERISATFPVSRGKDPSHFRNLLKKDEVWNRRSELLPAGTLTITFRMEVPAAEDDAPNPKVESPRPPHLEALETLSSDLRDLLEGNRKCDVTLTLQDKKFQAHRAVLSARSSVFRATYEHDTSEEQTGVSTIPDCDPDSFGYFLGYLYSGRTEELSFQTAYHLYVTADKYDVRRLKTFCADFLRQNLTLENVCDVVTLADLHADDGLWSSTQTFFNENFLKIFMTSAWATMLQDNFCLADKLLREMAFEVSRSTSKLSVRVPSGEIVQETSFTSDLQMKKNEKSDHKTTGALGDVSRVLEWNISDFQWLSSKKKYHSPRFSWSGCTWCLTVVRYHADGVDASLCLKEINPLMAGKTVTCAIGVKKADGTLAEKRIWTFNVHLEGDSFDFWELLNAGELRNLGSDLFPSGALVVTCRMEGVVLSSLVEVKPKLEALETLSSDFRDLLVTERKSDILLRVQGKDFRAHTARSPTFRDGINACGEKTGLLIIRDCDPDSFSRFLSYLYTGKAEGEMSFQTAYHLYITAAKYDVRKLRTLCADCLKQNLTVENICDVVTLADRHGDHELASSAQTFFNENFRMLFPKPEWAVMQQDHPHLANKLLSTIVSSIL